MTTPKDPKRLVLLKRLTKYLEDEVSVANGYQHDLKGAVFRGRFFFSKEDPVPMLSILENPDPDRYPPRAGRNGSGPAWGHEDLVLLIQGWAKDDKVNPSDPLYRLMADVQKALARLSQQEEPATLAPAAEHALLGGLATHVTPEPGVVRPPIEQTSELMCFWLRCSIGIVENPSDPYSLD